MKFAITSLTLALLLTFVSNAEGKAWHAIVPLQSTRADVVKALGEGIDSKNPGARFNLQTEDVYIAYSGKEPYGDECLRLLPPDLVLQIQVIPKLKFTLDSLGLKEKTLKTLAFSPEKPLRSQGFIDDDEGIVVSLNGTVEQIVYVPTRSDRARCAGYYRDLTVFVKTIVCILCPTIAVVSPNRAEAGTQINFNVAVSTGGSTQGLSFKWTVNEGIIVSGQGTDSIIIDSKAAKGKTIKATVEVDGIDPDCSKTASSETEIVRR